MVCDVITNFRRLSLVLAAAALALAGCGSDDNTDSSNPITTPIVQNCATGAVSGAGSTFVQTIVQQWVKDYTGACTGSTVNYQGVGSGAGIQQFLAGTVDFAGSDVPLSDAELTTAQAKYQAVTQLPWAAGGIAVEYNLPSVTNLQLSASTLAKIFSGTVKTWDDAAVAADNPGVKLPSTPVQIVHRSDGSGTTQAFSAYLAAVAPADWTLGSGKEVKWPVGQGAKGSDGVTAAVKAAEGSISYAEVSFAKANSLGIAKIQNASKAYTAPDAANVTAALASATIDAKLKVSFNYTDTNAASYPISTVSYLITPKAPSDTAKAALLKSFSSFAVTGGQSSAEKLFYAPLPQSLVTAATTATAGIGSAS